MILNGSEMRTGETIIMPMDISTLATSMSMMRNGMKMAKPIWNAVLSSLVTYAGIRMRMEMSSTFGGAGWRESFTNSARSASRVWRSMNVLSGPAPRSSASSIVMRFSERGL